MRALQRGLLGRPDRVMAAGPPTSSAMPPEVMAHVVHAWRSIETEDPSARVLYRVRREWERAVLPPEDFIALVEQARHLARGWQPTRPGAYFLAKLRRLVDRKDHRPWAVRRETANAIADRPPAPRRGADVSASRAYDLEPWRPPERKAEDRPIWEWMREAREREGA